MAKPATAFHVKQDFAAISGSQPLTTGNLTQFQYKEMAEAFPEVEPGIKPLTNFVIVQIRQPKRVTRGNIFLPSEARSAEHYNTQTAKVVALGPLCFHTARVWVDPQSGEPREHLVPNAEGQAFKVGDFVRVPKYGGDRFDVTHSYVTYENDPETGRPEKVTIDDTVIFAIHKVKDVIGLVTDPLKQKAYLD